MADPIGLKQYPQSTIDGTALPFDIGAPYGTYIVSVSAAALAADRKLPADVGLATVMSTVRALLSFKGAVPAITEDTFEENFILLPAMKLVHVYLPSNIFNCISTGDTGKIYMQLWRPWQSAGVEALKQRS